MKRLESHLADYIGSRVFDEQLSSRTLPGETLSLKDVVGHQVLTAAVGEGKPESKVHGESSKRLDKLGPIIYSNHATKSMRP